MVILNIFSKTEMYSKKTKILNLFKLATEDTLLSAWEKLHPIRYSESLTGLSAWKDDVQKIIGVTKEEDLLRILNDEINTSLVGKISDWSEFSSLFPNGEAIRRKWKKSSQKRSLQDFVAWMQDKNLNSGKNILNAMIPERSESIPAPVKEYSKEVIPQSFVGSATSDDYFYQKILEGVGAPVTNNNMAYLYAWRQAEGGKATFNPFNTTQKAEGTTNYNSVGVKNYVSAEQGIAATIKTLLNGRYSAIIDCLKKDCSPDQTAKALIESPWGTGELVSKVISGYMNGAKPKPPPISGM